MDAIKTRYNKCNILNICITSSRDMSDGHVTRRVLEKGKGPKKTKYIDWARHKKYHL